MDALATDLAAATNSGHKAWLRYLRSALAPLLVVILLAISILATFLEGQRRGMDHVATFGPASDQNSIAVALSDVVYKLNLGYLGYTSVLDSLLAVWNQGAKGLNDPILIERGRDRTVLNSAIHAAASLGPQTPGYVTDRTLFTMYYDDLGFIDYVKYAFELFGLKFEAMYYLFFTILALSALAFLITFRTNPIAQAVLLANVFVFLIEIYVDNFPSSMPTFAGMRHGSTLGLLPMWHFIFLTASRSRLSVVNVALAIFQLLVLILAIKTRGSAAWMVLFIVGVALLQGLWRWFRTTRTARSWRQLLHLFAQWPVILLLTGLFANAQYMNATLHPAYFTDDAVPYHTIWHSIYLGLIDTPELRSPYVSSIMAQGVSGDNLGYYAALEYLRDSHFMPSDASKRDVYVPAFGSAWASSRGQGDRKYRLYNAIMFHVVMGLVRQHPVVVLRHYLATPVQVAHTIVGVFRSAPDRTWLLLTMMAGLIIAASFGITAGVARVGDIWTTVFLAAVTVPLSAIPNLIAYAVPHAIPDLLLSLLILFQITIWASVMLVADRLKRSNLTGASIFRTARIESGSVG